MHFDRCFPNVPPQADATLRYTPQHKPLLLQLPNMKTIKMTISFSSVVFKAVAEICLMLSESPAFISGSCSMTLDLKMKDSPPCLASSFLPPSFLIPSDIRRSEELSLLKPPDDPSKKKKKKEKNSAQEDIWDIDLFRGGPGGTGTRTIPGTTQANTRNIMRMFS